MKKIAIFVHDIYEDLELWYPALRLKEEGFHIVIAGPKAHQQYLGKHGYPCLSDTSFKDLKSSDFDGVIIPGGYAPDKIRLEKEALNFINELDQQKKLIAAICHAGWVLISAKMISDRTLTGYIAIKDDLENAGAHFKDEEVVIDRNLITSRTPKDLPVFSKTIIEFLKA